mgnify:CR=1 FL=1
MNSKKRSEKIYIEKIKLLEKYNKFYYQKQKSLVTDDEFDNLKQEILILENKHKYKNSKSPSVQVGFEPSKNFKKFKHRVKMLSLSNAFSKEDLINFQKKKY